MDNKDVAIFEIEGSPTILRIGEYQSSILEFLEKNKSRNVKINVSNVDKVDITFYQLILSLKRLENVSVELDLTNEIIEEIKFIGLDKELLTQPD